MELSELFTAQEKLIKELLEQKYQASFSVEEIQSFNYTSGLITGICYEDSEPTTLFRTYVNALENTFSDEYISKLLANQVTEKANEALDCLHGYYYVHSAQLFADSSLSNPSVTLEEYISFSENRDFNINVFYCPGDEPPEDVAANLFEAFTQAASSLSELTGMFYLYLGDDEFMKNIQNYLETHDMIYHDFQNIASNQYCRYFAFKNGVLCAEKEEIERAVNKE